MVVWLMPFDSVEPICHRVPGMHGLNKTASGRRGSRPQLCVGITGCHARSAVDDESDVRQSEQTGGLRRTECLTIRKVDQRAVRQSVGLLRRGAKAIVASVITVGGGYVPAALLGVT